jgi:glycine cleavage system H protein
MSTIPAGLKFLKSHEWARQEADGSITVGISDHAQNLLGDLVYIELPEVGKHFDGGAACAVVESVKAASDVYCPVAGTVTQVNDALADRPETVNRDPWGEGWLFVLRPDDVAALEGLLDAEAYAALIA